MDSLNLAEMIAAIKRQIFQPLQTPEQGPEKLALTEMELQLQFTVTEGKGDDGKTEFVIAPVKATAKAGAQNAHTMKLCFKAPEPAGAASRSAPAARDNRAELAAQVLKAEKAWAESTLGAKAAVPEPAPPAAEPVEAEPPPPAKVGRQNAVFQVPEPEPAAASPALQAPEPEPAPPAPQPPAAQPAGAKTVPGKRKKLWGD